MSVRLRDVVVASVYKATCVGIHAYTPKTLMLKWSRTTMKATLRTRQRHPEMLPTVGATAAHPRVAAVKATTLVGVSYELTRHKHA